MSASLLILTAGFGEGHNAAARALAAGWEDLSGAGGAEVADLYALAAPRFNATLRRAYLGLINRSPGTWNAIYRWLDRSRIAPRLLAAPTAERRVLARLLRERAPRGVACTYPAYAFMLAALSRDGGAPMPWFNVVTDSITINSLWWRAGADAWFAPNEETATIMQSAGVPRGQVHSLGFPVPRFFADHEGKLVPPDLGAGAVPRVLYIINSGTRGAAETARLLLQQTPWELTLTVGANQTLRDELARLASTRGHPTRILGWTQEIPRLLLTHHAVVSKAGGATTQEALAARCPMIVNQVVPGQEEGNYELLRRHGVGALATTPGAVVAELERAFLSRGRVWRDWRERLQPLSRPRAAHDIAVRIRDLMAVPARPGRRRPIAPRTKATPA